MTAKITIAFISKQFFHYISRHVEASICLLSSSSVSVFLQYAVHLLELVEGFYRQVYQPRWNILVFTPSELHDLDYHRLLRDFISFMSGEQYSLLFFIMQSLSLSVRLIPFRPLFLSQNLILNIRNLCSLPGSYPNFHTHKVLPAE